MKKFQTVMFIFILTFPNEFLSHADEEKQDDDKLLPKGSSGLIKLVMDNIDKVILRLTKMDANFKTDLLTSTIKAKTVHNATLKKFQSFVANYIKENKYKNTEFCTNAAKAKAEAIKNLVDVQMEECSETRAGKFPEMLAKSELENRKLLKELLQRFVEEMRNCKTNCEQFSSKLIEKLKTLSVSLPEQNNIVIRRLRSHYKAIRNCINDIWKYLKSKIETIKTEALECFEILEP